MRSFWKEVDRTKRLGLSGDLDADITRITNLIKRRLGEVQDPVVLKIVEDVLPYHLYAAASGVREDNSIEYTSLALGEDIRVAVNELT